MEPLQIRVVRPSRELVATLLVGSNKRVVNLKTQLEGLEGTPAGKQKLVLDGCVLENETQLSSLGLEDLTTVVLMHTAPLLSGSLTWVDLFQLLDDDAALERAIHAYAADPQYSLAEVGAIMSSVAATLLPGDRLVVGQVLSDLAAAGFATSASEGKGRAAQRTAFKRALRAALVALVRRSSLVVADSDPAAVGAQAPANKASGAVPSLDAAIGPGPVAHDRPPRADAAIAALPEVRAACQPWRGAGEELHQKLFQRWSKLEAAEEPGRAAAA